MIPSGLDVLAKLPKPPDLMPQAHPLDVKIKGIAFNATATVRDWMRNFLWDMRFNGTWVLTVDSQSDTPAELFECIRKERDSAKVKICVGDVTYLCFLTPPRRYRIEDVISKLKAKNVVKKSTVKEERIAQIKEALQHPTEPPKDVYQKLAEEAKEFVEGVATEPTPEPVMLPKVHGHKFSAEEQESLKDLVGLFTSGMQGKMNWFFRKMNGKSAEFQNEIWHQLKNLGHAIEEAQKRVADGPKSPISSRKVTLDIPAVPEGQTRRIEWSDAEWEHLTDLIESMRRNNPEPPLSVLIKRAQAQIPADRRRKLTSTKLMEPLVTRLKLRAQNLAHAKLDLEKLIKKMADQESAPDKAEILVNLTDEEVVQNFSQRILDSLAPAEIFAQYPTEVLLEFIPNSLLIGTAVQKIIEGISETSTNFNHTFGDIGSALAFLKKEGGKTVTPSIPAPRPIAVVGRKPRVTVVGMIADQPISLESRLAGRAQFTFTDKDQSKVSVANTADIVVFWAKFCSHKMQNQIKNTLPSSCRLIVHHGGVKKLAETLDAMLPRC